MKRILYITSFILLLTGCNLIYISDEQAFLKRGGELRTCEGNYPSVKVYSDSGVLKLSDE